MLFVEDLNLINQWLLVYDCHRWLHCVNQTPELFIFNEWKALHIPHTKFMINLSVWPCERSCIHSCKTGLQCLTRSTAFVPLLSRNIIYFKCTHVYYIKKRKQLNQWLPKDSDQVIEERTKASRSVKRSPNNDMCKNNYRAVSSKITSLIRGMQKKLNM